MSQLTRFLADGLAAGTLSSELSWPHTGVGTDVHCASSWLRAAVYAAPAAGRTSGR